MNKALNPTWKNFFHFALPSMAAMVIFSSYTIIDGIFVAKGVSDLAMAAVNLSLPFINVLSGLAVLLTMGTSTLCAFALGKGDQKKAEELFTQTVVVILIVSAVISVAVSIFAKPLAYLLGARELTIGYSSQYLHVVCLFSVCVILSYCLEVMVKVDGRPQLAMIGMAISFVIHIGLDYIFIFHLHLEVLGSALATGLSHTGSLIFFLAYVLSGKSNLRFRKFKWNLRKVVEGLPLGVADCSVEFVLGFLTMLYNHVIVATLGEESLPIYAVISYITILVFFLMQGIAQGMMPLVSLAEGHNDHAASRNFLRKCLITVVVTGVIVELICQLAPGPVVSILLEGENVLYDDAVSALRQYALSYLLTGFSIALAGYFAALGRGPSSMLLSLGRGFILLPGALLALNALTGGSGIWMAALVGEVLSVLLGFALLRRAEHRQPVLAASQG